MEILFILLFVLVILDIAAWKWGADSRNKSDCRDGKDEWFGEQRWQQ